MAAINGKNCAKLFRVASPSSSIKKRLKKMGSPIKGEEMDTSTITRAITEVVALVDQKDLSDAEKVVVLKGCVGILEAVIDLKVKAVFIANAMKNAP